MDQQHARDNGVIDGIICSGSVGNESEYKSRCNSNSNNNDRRSLKKQARLAEINNSYKNKKNDLKENNTPNYQPRKENDMSSDKTHATTLKDPCQKIRNCKTLMEVLQLLRRESGSLKPSHLSFYWNQIPRLICTGKSSSSMDSSSGLQRLRRNPELLKSLVGLTIRHNSALNPRSLAVTACAMAKISSKMRKPLVSLDKLWELLGRNIIQKATAPRDNFSSQECADIVWSFAKEFGGRQQQGDTPSSTLNPFLLFNAMLIEISPKLHLCNAQDIGNMVWAYATANHPAPSLLDAIIPMVIEKLDKFDSHSLTNILWAYATLGHPAAELFDAIAATLAATVPTSSVTNSGNGNKLDALNPQEISNTIWAFALIGDYTPNSILFLDALATSAKGKMDLFNSRDLAMMLRGYATLNHSSPELFDSLSHQSIKLLPTFNSQEIANTVWAYASLGHSASELFHAISKLVIDRIDTINFNPQEIAKMVWAYAKLKYTHLHLFNAMSQLAFLKLDGFNSQDIADTMWAYATMNYPAPEFFDAVSNLGVSKLNTFSSQELATTLEAFAILTHPAPEFFDAVSNLTLSKLHTFNSQQLVKTIRSYATLYQYDVNPYFTNSILWESIQKLEYLESDQIINILWSAAVLNSVDAKLVVMLFSEISKRYYLSENNFQLSRKTLLQLHQASMWYRKEYHCNEPLLPIQLLEECFATFSRRYDTLVSSI